jgi:SAM-dependent methyltransferase
MTASRPAGARLGPYPLGHAIGAGVVLALLLPGCAQTAPPSPAAAPSAFGELTRLGRGNTDKADTHQFTEIYEHIFDHMKSSPIRIAEIGIAGGGSLKLWAEYFTRSEVFGLDIHTLDELRAGLEVSPEVKDQLDSIRHNPRIKTFVADQANRTQLQAFIDTHGADFDIVFDDGGHTMEMQQTSFGFFFRHLNPGGYYVIEDVHTSLPDRFEGYGADLDESNTTLTMVNGIIRHGKVKSMYLTPDEIDYLNKHIEYVNLFSRQNEPHSTAAIFRKRTR